jgi:hypothetical protein
MRRIAPVLVSIALVLIAAGCGGKKTMAPANDANLPDFMLNQPKQAGYLFGVGIAEQQSLQLAMETADLRAKKEIAKVMSQKISNLMKDFMGQAGLGTEAEVTEFTQSITKSVTDVELVGCTIEKRENKGGKMYSLAKLPLDAKFREQMKTVVEKSLTSKEALLSEFRAKQGFEDLDKELTKLEQAQP